MTTYRRIYDISRDHSTLADSTRKLDKMISLLSVVNLFRTSERVGND